MDTNMKYTLTYNDNIITVTVDDKSFNIKKTAESYLVDGEYFVKYDELIQILADIKLSEELNNKE